MDLSENPADFKNNIPIPTTINPKPFANCTGCEEFGESCHCLCHKEPMANGVHRIIYREGD